MFGNICSTLLTFNAIYAFPFLRPYQMYNSIVGKVETNLHATFVLVISKKYFESYKSRFLSYRKNIFES